MKRLGMLVVCSLCLFGCAKGQTVDQDALAELQEDNDITYEEWKEQEAIKEKERGKKAQEEYRKAVEQYEKDMAERERQEQLKASRGMTYDNFKLIGSTDYITVNSINELLDCKGELVSEYGSHTIYQWEDRNGFKLVTVGFENGIAVSKTQVGL